MICFQGIFRKILTDRFLFEEIESDFGDDEDVIFVDEFMERIYTKFGSDTLRIYNSKSMFLIRNISFLGTIVCLISFGDDYLILGTKNKIQILDKETLACVSEVSTRKLKSLELTKDYLVSIHLKNQESHEANFWKIPRNFGTEIWIRLKIKAVNLNFNFE
jgi:hypothetical protein